MGKSTQAVIAHAADHDGVVTRREALALGMTSRTLDRRVEDGVLIRMATSVFALPGVFRAEESTMAAATRALGGVVSHQSAARFHGVDVPGPRMVISVPHRRTHLFADVVVHQLTDIRRADIVTVGSVPTTSAARTTLDLAAVLSQKQLGRTIDRFASKGLATFEEMEHVLEDLARKGKPGVIRMRRALEPRLGSGGTSESDLESRLLEVIRISGLPEPEVQHRPAWLKHVNGRVDLAYPNDLLVIEGDSRAWHGDEHTFQADRERDNLAQLAGWRILRFTWHDITRRPDYVVLTIRRALGGSLHV